jgi:pimeloyl-ACP methyl ester carboxylesterase
VFRLVAALLFSLACGYATAADIGAIVIHGKWGLPDALEGLASALEKQGYAVAVPEMPWSRRRNYDRSVEEADREIDAQVDKLRVAGAKRIVLVGHSLGAAYALHYGGRTQVDAIVAIAPGHRPENPRIAQTLADDVKRARDHVAAGRPAETISFTDFNSGGRRSRMTASAASFTSYFDPAGPMNMGRNVESLKPTPVLWMVPTREESPLREGNIALYKRLPQNAGNQLAEPGSDHMQAPQASIPTLVEWLKKVVSPSP